MNKLKILLIEDDVEISAMLKGYLTTENFEVACAFDGQEACSKFDYDTFSLVLLDLMIPKINGMDVMQYIRKSSIVPIIIISAKDSETDKTLGLGLGADDYITKPFSVVEVLARIKSNIRRTIQYNKLVPASPELLVAGNLAMNLVDYTVTKKGEQIELTAVVRKTLNFTVSTWATTARIVLKMLDLVGAGNKPVREYSLGMKQRLGLARAILTKPEFLVLDEPTNGLDPAGIKQIRDLLKTLSQEHGITIMISSHNLPEIENLVDTVGVINKGKLMKELSLSDIQRANLSYIELIVDNVKQAAYVLSEHLHIGNFKVMDSSVIRIYDTLTSTQELSKQMIENNVSIESLSKKNDSLEDYFLKMTKEDA